VKKTVLINIEVCILAVIMTFMSACSGITVGYSEENDELETYLSGYDVSDEYIEEIDERVTEKYQGYIHMGDDASSYHIACSETEVEARYGDVIFDETVESDTYVENDDDYFDIAAVRMIHKNIIIMNELVDEEYGEINEDFEFVFYETDEFVEQWRAWGFRLRWNKFSVNFDCDFAIVFSTVFMVFYMVKWCLEPSDALSYLTDEDGVSRLIIDFCDTINRKAFEEIVTMLSGEARVTVVKLILEIVTSVSGSKIALRILKIVLEMLMPSKEDCIVILYKAYATSCGMALTLCWIPTWWDKWGFSIKAI